MAAELLPTLSTRPKKQWDSVPFAPQNEKIGVPATKNFKIIGILHNRPQYLRKLIMKKLFLSLLLFFLGGCSSVTKVNYQGSSLWRPMNFGIHYVLKKPAFLIEVFDEEKSYIALVPPNTKDAWHVSPTSIDAYLANPKDLSWNGATNSGGDKKGILDYINRWHPGFPKEVFEKLKDAPLYDYFDLLRDHPDPFFNLNAYYCCRAVGIADIDAIIVAHEAYAVDYFSPISSPVNHRRYMRFAKYKNEKDLIVNIDSVLGKKFLEYFEEVN